MTTKTPDDPVPAQEFELGTLRIDPRAGEVSGPGGLEKLEPRVMDVLVMLARHAGQVVQREELLAKLWPDAAPSDDVLSRCIYELRRQLSLAGNDEQLKALVETVPKRGYRLRGRIAWPAPSARPPVATPRRRSLVPALLAIAGAALATLLWHTLGRQAADPAEDPRSSSGNVAANSIAVLPFLDMSANQDQGHFADGITEEILLRLDRFENLRVIARTSSFAFRGKPRDIREIAALLDVTHVLEGSVRRSGDDIRITAQLIAASDNAHVWSRTFDHASGDLFAVQDEVATAVATALQVTLAGAPPEWSMPVKPEAYELFLQGRFFYNRRAPDDIERAARYFRDALALDPTFARAWAALAGAYNLMLVSNEDAEEQLRPLQGEAAMKAVELGPGLAVAHARLAQYYDHVGERGKGREHFARAMALDPDDPLVMGFSTDDAVLRADFEGAVEIWRRLVERDPLAPIDRGNYANSLLRAGKAGPATEQFRKALELSPELGWKAHFGLLRSLVLQRRYDEAEAEIPRLAMGLPRDYALAFLHEAPGRRQEADAALDRLVSAGEEADRVVLAEIFAFRGLVDEAFAALAVAQQRIEGQSVPAYIERRKMHALRMEMLWSPFLVMLHPDPRWNELVAALGRKVSGP